MLPSKDRRPKWARRLEHVTNHEATNAQGIEQMDLAANPIMDRLRNLEGLVKELRGQLEQANASASPTAGSSSGVVSPESTSYYGDTGYQSGTTDKTKAGNVQKHFGRLVLQDTSQSRYVSSGFWSRVNDEVR